MFPSALSAFSFPFPSAPGNPSFLRRNPNPSSNFPSPSQLRPRRHRFRNPCRRADRSWDSNAESFRAGRFRFSDDAEREGGGGGFWRKEKRRWWSDESSSDALDEDEREEAFDYEDEIEQLWDRIWIFKVFKAYGYLLPFIIASMLLATGPKAFLMALALPLGQSALSLTIEKVFGNGRVGPRTESKRRTKPFVRSTSDFKWRKREKGKNDVENGKQGYQSWVSGDVGAPNQGNRSSRVSFGGWDELDGEDGPAKRPMQSGRPIAKRSSDDAPGSNGKLSKRGRYREAPLFLRLLIAVFPFLGSWTRIL